MFCENCGAQVPDGAKFCESCGSPVKVATPEPVAETEETVSTIENVTENAEVVQESGEYDYDQPAQQPSAYESGNGYTGYTDPYAQPQGGKIGFAIASLVCGILSLVCCCTSWTAVTLGVVAIVMGIIVLVKAYNGKGMAITGLITGGLGVLLALIVSVGSLAGANVMEEYFEDYLEKVDPDSLQQFEDIMDEIDL